MHSLKDNNPEVYKIFSEASVVIQCAIIENGQDRHPIHLVIKKVIMRDPLKVMGVKNEIRATGVVANEVAKMGRKEVCKYSLKRSEKLKLYQRKHHLNLALNVKLLLFMACYFKG